MPTITPGNRLYLYQLLSNELGVGAQTALARVEEVLAKDDLAPADLGFADTRSLCEALPEFLRVTAFKKGYVYATVHACEDYDRALEGPANGASSKSAANGKPWKRRKEAKGLRPVKPRPTEKPKEATPSTPEALSEPQRIAEPKPSHEFGSVPGAEQSEAEPKPDIGFGSEAEPEGEPKPEAAGASATALEPALVADPTSATQTEPAAASEPKPEGEPRRAPVFGSPEPSISLTITYVPEQKEGEAEPKPAAARVDEPATAHTARSSMPSTTHAPSGPPQDFHAEVRSPNEQLSLLYQLLPPTVDPLTTLEEDFRVARSTHTLEGTRSEVTFPLRFLRADGSTPVTATLRRSVKAQGGKFWSLASVDGADPDEVGLEGLAPRPAGAWAAFLPQRKLPVDAVDPERALTQTVSLGPWDEALQDLASLAAPEDWGADRSVLRAYLIMTFARVQAQGLLAVAPDGSRAEFDTGLLTSAGAPVYARLEPLDGDIPWELAAFATGGSARPARYATSLAQVTLDSSLPAPAFAAAPLVERSPRTATCAYDAIADDVRLLVPADDGRALALAATPSGYEVAATLELADAYACARVVSAEQPSWLTAGLA
jgi:hypothetical protein